MNTAYPTSWHRPPQLIRSRPWRVALMLVAVAYLIVGIGSVEVNWARMVAGLERGQRFD